jgi:hypothetical protein
MTRGKIIFAACNADPCDETVTLQVDTGKIAAS